MRLIDLRHLGRERVIGAWLLGDTLIDPGPESCMQTLLEGLDGQVPARIALTHIHLDHAGATGALLRRFPGVEVLVHERGAPHLIDPTRLLASAGRLYGDDMDRLWGEVLPVPAERVRSLLGGERIAGFHIAYTPGHASHHVSYLHEESGTAFCGDTAGVRIAERAPVLAPTPPPDIDLAAWRRSIETIEAWRPSALVPTHFGRYEDVEAHLAQLRERLLSMEARAAGADEGEFVEGLHGELAAQTTPELLAVYEQAMPLAQTYAGLRRWLQRG